MRGDHLMPLGIEIKKPKLNKTKKINSQQQFKYFPIYIANFLGPSNTKLSFLVKKIYYL